MSSKTAQERAAKELAEFEEQQAESQTATLPQEEKSDQQKQTHNEPMGVTLSRARQDMTMAILQIQNMYGLPAYLTDLIVTASLADIRDCANKDLLNSMSE